MALNTALLVAAAGLGLAASPHCALMCGAPCASVGGGCARSAASLHAGRLLGYGAAGALAGGSMAALAAVSQAAPALRPLWMLMQLGFLALGLWWLATGRQPRWARGDAALASPIRLMPQGRPAVRAGLAGLAWVALPCGLLQGALMLAALSNDALGGALVMLTFALVSAPALALTPWLWSRWRWLRGTVGASAPGLRLAGLGLVLMSGWALTRGLWLQLAAWCLA